MRLTSKKIIGTLKRQGYKLTPQRRWVIEAIASAQDCLTPHLIYEKVHLDHPHIGLVTIYRTLEILSKLELICELHTGGMARSYTVGTSEHHHHLICSRCGKVVDFTGYHLAELEHKLSRETGFKIGDHLLEFTGICQTCQKESNDKLC